MFGLFKNYIDENERVKGALFGFFVGDALGVPVEFVKREELKKDKVTGMREYGSHNQPIGTWSDDSSMVIATMDSIINNKDINYDDIMNNFLKWYDDGEFTPGGKVFDIGYATAKALTKYRSNKTNCFCGDDDVYSNGNGSLMRILPIVIYYQYYRESAYDAIRDVSRMTHAHGYSIFSCILYAEFIDDFLAFKNLKAGYARMQYIADRMLRARGNISRYGDLEDLRKKFSRIISGDISTLKESDIKSTGYVIDTLEACFWCLLTTNSYKEAVLKAVNLGNDTDTIGALTGALAGLVYGYKSIPKNWIKVLKRKDYLDDLVNKYMELMNELPRRHIAEKWTNFPGSMSKAMKGENPMPKKEIKATKESWKNKPLTISKEIDCNIVLNEEEFKMLSMGHIPSEMEDHWFLYCDDEAINYFRSWTGIPIFKGYYKVENNSYIIYKLEVNDNKDEYSENNDKKSLELFNNLVKADCEKYE